MLKVYVGNLTLETTEQEIFDIFSTYGSVESVKIIRDRNNNNSNFAFVSLTSGAKEAIEGLQDHYLNNSKLKAGAECDKKV